MAEAEQGARDERGEWQPEVLPVPGELFHWPPRPVGIARYLFAPGAAAHRAPAGGVDRAPLASERGAHRPRLRRSAPAALHGARPGHEV